MSQLPLASHGPSFANEAGWHTTLVVRVAEAT